MIRSNSHNITSTRRRGFTQNMSSVALIRVTIICYFIFPNGFILLLTSIDLSLRARVIVRSCWGNAHLSVAF